MLPVLAVVVADQVLGAFAQRRRLPELLGSPAIARNPGRTHMHDLSVSVLDDEEGEGGPEEQVVQLEEVSSPGVVPVVLEERFPGLVEPGEQDHSARRITASPIERTHPMTMSFVSATIFPSVMASFSRRGLGQPVTDLGRG